MKSAYCISFVWLTLCLSALASSPNWPQFRGVDASGLSDQPAPTEWELESGKNVRWQKPIPGLGHACPIVWEDRVYITTAVKPGGKSDLKVGIYGDGASYTEKEPHQWRLLCFEKRNGEWKLIHQHASVPAGGEWDGKIVTA